MESHGSMNKDNFERAKWIPIFILAIILMVIYKTFDNFSGITAEIRRFLWIISPLLFGILFSYFLYLPVEKLTKLFGKAKIKRFAKRSRGFSVLAVFLVLIAVIVFVIIVIIPPLFRSVIDLAIRMPDYLNQVLDYFRNLPEDSILLQLNIIIRLEEYAENLISQFSFQDVQGVIEQFSRGMISVADGLISVVLGLIIALYLLLELERIREFFKRLSKAMFKSEKNRDRLDRFLGHIHKVLVTFIASKGLDSMINIVVVTSILLIFDVYFAFLLGIFAGLMNFIPYLGSLIAVISISVITVLTGGPAKAVQVLIPLLIFQQLDGNFIEPRIMKTSLKISPILVIISVIAGGAYFGIVGMFLAVPVVTIIKQILLEYMGNAEK